MELRHFHLTIGIKAKTLTSVGVGFTSLIVRAVEGLIDRLKFCPTSFLYPIGYHGTDSHKQILTMFKKPFSILSAFVLGLIISASIMACADDLQQIVNCNCNDTIKDLLARVETLEKQVKTIKEPNYDSLVQLVVNRINTTTPTPPTEDDGITEERIASIEQEVAQLKNASAMENIGSYNFTSSSASESASAKYEYDNNGRLTKATCTTIVEGNTYVDVWTCTYNGNVCTVTSGGATEVFTLSNDQSRNFKLINDIIVEWAID